MQKTIFSKIIGREIPADIVYEDDICIGILAIKPVRPGHTLLISKQVYPWIEEVPAEILSHMMTVAQNMIRDMKSQGADYVRISIVGAEVPHFHIHLIPQHFSDHVHN